ncbi:TPA: hypothetical protein DCE37_03670 [Candidatus Latescibacteria bacterium]|nr:hypothetical protein [Candidatus Latescibacterota bacterium]
MDLEVSHIQRDVTDLTLDQTSLTLAPGATADAIVKLVPSAEATVSGEVSFQTNDPEQRSVVIPLTEILVEGGLPVAVAVAESNLSLGDIDITRTGSGVLTIRNDGKGPLLISSIESDLSGVSFSMTVLGLQPGSTQTVTVTVGPNAEGAFNGTIKVLSNDSNQALLSIPFLGTGIVISVDPRVDFDGPTVIDFGDFLRGQIR